MKDTLIRFVVGAAACPVRHFRRYRQSCSGVNVLSAAPCFALLLLAMSVSPSAFAQANAGSTVATRYIEALQKADFKTVIDLSYGYQGEVSQIKAQNPQVLWPKLTKDYYDAKIATLANKPGFWEAYMQGMMGDPAQQIRFMQTLMLPNVKWKVTETRADHVQDSIQFGGYDRTIVYITVNYPTLNDSPFVDRKFLKETILEIDVNSKSQLVMTLGRLPQGDTAWDAPLMIMNTSWSLSQVPFTGGIDGHLRAEAIGGKAPYTWTPRCGPVDLSRNLTKRDGLGQPIDQRNVPFLMVDLDAFPRNSAFPQHCTVTVTDGTGQTDTVGMTVPRMVTGLINAYCFVRPPWFSRGQGRPGQPTTCTEPVLSTDAATSSASIEPPPPAAAGDTPAPPVSVTQSPGTSAGNTSAASCGDYNGCMQAAMNAYRAKNWSSATADFQAAANQRPTSGEPYIWLGRILFMDNQPHQQSDLTNVWDKALSLGAQIMIGACHELTLRPCERGDLALSTKSVAFLANGSQEVFSAAPADITPGRILNNSAAMHISYSMKVANKNYAIDFIPLGTQGCQFNLMVQCPQEGITKQVVTAQYVSQVLPKLASGALAVKVAPVASPAAPPPPAPTVAPAKSVCDLASDAGYAILLQGHLYKVRLSGPAAGPDHKLFFFDEKGTQVTDTLLLMQLAAAVWTHDNVISSAGDARNGSTRVSGILGTSKALQTYTAVQDVIARAMVEAVEAGFTGGASLTKAVPNVTLGALKAQLTNAPKTLLTLAAQHGLEASLTAYKQMEAVPLPPEDATALNATDLARLRDLYIQARSLELPYEALAAKLMPTSGSELTEQALKSALGELTGGPLFSGAPTSAVTLQNLLNLQKGVANLAKSLPALQAYSQDLNLATNLTTANSETISKWASAAAQKCN